jgi:hypothetical protein
MAECGLISDMGQQSIIVQPQGFLVVTLSLLLVCNCRAEEINTMQMKSLKNETSAIARAVALTGLDAVSKKISVQRTVISGDNTAFLAARFNGTQSWVIEFDDATLTGKLTNAQVGYKDPYQFQRNFRVFLDSKTGQLLIIKSNFKGGGPATASAPDSKSAENQLKGIAENYEGLPTVDPKVTFLQAIDIVLGKGARGSPFAAKEIDGFYVMDSRNGSPPKPVWIVTLRGLPPIPSHWSKEPVATRTQNTTMRNVVDAINGELLFGTNFPR